MAAQSKLHEPIVDVVTMHRSDLGSQGSNHATDVQLLCVCVCMCVCMCVYMYDMCVYMCICIYVCVCVSMCGYVCICVYVCVCMYVCVYVGMCVLVGGYVGGDAWYVVLHTELLKVGWCPQIARGSIYSRPTCTVSELQLYWELSESNLDALRAHRAP